jgi:hypothetical protein
MPTLKRLVTENTLELFFEVVTTANKQKNLQQKHKHLCNHSRNSPLKELHDTRKECGMAKLQQYEASRDENTEKKFRWEQQMNTFLPVLCSAFDPLLHSRHLLFPLPLHSHHLYDTFLPVLCSAFDPLLLFNCQMAGVLLN